MQAIFNRRSVRRYNNQIVEPEKVEKILRAAMQAPSAYSQKSWEFIVVRDKDKLQRLSELNPYTKSIATSSVTIVVLGNENIMRCPEHWQQDLGACTQNILLEATHLDLGAVWLGVAPTKEYMDIVSEELNLPDHIKPFSMISIGYPLEGQGNKFVDRYDESKIHNENY